MIWKDQLNVDSKVDANSFKQELQSINPKLIVKIENKNGQYLVKCSIENIDISQKSSVSREIKKIFYEYRYGDKGPVAKFNRYVAGENANPSKSMKKPLKSLIEQYLIK